MKVITFDSKVCQNLDQALKKEWLETNQFGGFASSTIASANTRREHGLLVAQLKPPLGHHILLNNLEETLFIDDVGYPLSTQIYQNTVYPEGYQNLSEFSLLPFPTWIFRIEDLVFAKTLVFMHEEQTVFVRYQILEGDENFVRLELKPLTAFRHFKSLTRKNERLSTKLEVASGRIQFAGVFFHHNAAIADQSGAWQCGIQYPEEKKLGLDFEEDLYAPFRLVYTFTKGREVFFCASLEYREKIDPAELISKEQDRRYRLLKNIHIADSRFQTLANSGQSFLVHSMEKPNSLQSSVLMSNYPSCENSARDTLIAFHGLTLTMTQYPIAHQILLRLGNQVRNGLLPARQPDCDGTVLARDQKQGVDYGAIDSPLWLVYRSFEYLRYSEDRKTVEQNLFPVLDSIIDSYVKGTHFGIHVAEDGLVSGDGKGTPLTWMDRKAGRSVVTPRDGKAVEIQALWYNALCAMAFMADAFGKATLKKKYQELALQAKRSFNSIFWNASEGYLYDVINLEGNKDASLRPNQLLALGLTFPLLDQDARKWNSILEITKRILLTPYGLRTLAPDELQYQGICNGDQLRRARAYHQGAVWPWLFVPFLSAFLRTHQDSKQAQEWFLNFIAPFFNHLENRGLGFASEVFDGDPPHEARGAIAQAISIGPALELHEMLIGERATPEKLNVLTLG